LSELKLPTYNTIVGAEAADLQNHCSFKTSRGRINLGGGG
jgi:hypothetical protein